MINAARSLLVSPLRARPIAKTTFNGLFSRTIVTVKDTKFSVTASASGQGRNGSVKCMGSCFKLAAPKALAGCGGRGHNPEQLFAMAYASCFLGVIQATARSMKKELQKKKTIVHATVNIGEPHGKEGLALAVDLKVAGGGVDKELIDAALENCPYSRALRLGSTVKVSLSFAQDPKP